MRALTLQQPWASLCFLGGPAKVHETRSWPAPRDLIGQRLLIHAATRQSRTLVVRGALLDLVRETFGRDPDEVMRELPYGAAIGSVRVDSCLLTPSAKPASEADAVAGDWGRGRFAWRLSDPRPFPEARPLRGRQGVWIVPESFERVAPW
jgi:hypothetical protein